MFLIQLKKRLPAVLVTVFSVAAFGLYYLGVYDISFIERPESWKGNLDAFISVLDKSYKTPAVPDDTSDEPNVPADGDGTKKPKRPGKSERPTEPSNAVIYTFEDVAALKEQGYALTDRVWDSNCVFGILSTDYELPKSLRPLTPRHSPHTTTAARPSAALSATYATATPSKCTWATSSTTTTASCIL